MLKIFRIIRNFILNQKEDLKFYLPPMISSSVCYECHKTYDRKSFWGSFIEINGKAYQVPICDKCGEKLNTKTGFKNE